MRKALRVGARAIDGVDVPPCAGAWVLVESPFFPNDWDSGKFALESSGDSLLRGEVGMGDMCTVRLDRDGGRAPFLECGKDRILQDLGQNAGF